MAHFRGEVFGNRSGTSRLGSKNSGITTNCQSWGGDIRVNMWYDESIDKDRYEIRISAHAGCGKSILIERGIVTDRLEQGE